MIDQLITLSQSVAYDVSIVQGAGGNTSIKEDNILCIKASGISLSDISLENGWVKLNLQQWREDFNKFHSNNEDEFSSINIKNTIEGKRASIETGLHALLPHKYVLHTHSVYANFFLCGGRTEELVDYIHSNENVRSIVIPTCAPGLQLTRHLAQELQNIDNSQPIIVFLKNHGIAISCNNLNETVQLHAALHDGVKKYFKLATFTPFTITNNMPLSTNDNKAVLTSSAMWRSQDTISNITKNFFKEPKVFFPDQVVYINTKLNNQIILSKDNNNDYIVYQLSKQQAQNTAEILATVIYLYENIKKPQVLAQGLCEYIANMSGEKYRQHLEK